MGKRTSVFQYGTEGTAARKLAIESLQNIANVQLDSPELSAVVGLLADHPMAVSDLARRLVSFDSDRLATVLARGGESGLLSFRKEGDDTIVALKDPS